MNRILIIRLSAIGDVLHSTTVAHNLKLRFPDCHISWLASPPASELLSGNPDIDQVLVWDRREMDQAMASLNLPRAIGCLRRAAQLLRPHHFDIVLDIQCLFLTGLLARLSGVPRRIGIHERHEGNHFFMTELGPNIREPHKIRRYMTALQPLGVEDYLHFEPGLVLRLPSALDGFANDFWQQHGIDPARPLLMVNVRTTWPDKNWPPKNFGIALGKLPNAVQIVFCGAPKDTPFIEEAQKTAGRPTLSIAGETSLLELAALLKSASLLLTGDTGPLYLAEAVGTPTLSLWGPTHPNIYGPLTPGHSFVLTPHGCAACCKTKCRHRTNACMNAIRPETVAGELKKIFHISGEDA